MPLEASAVRQGSAEVLQMYSFFSFLFLGEALLLLLRDFPEGPRPLAFCIYAEMNGGQERRDTILVLPEDLPRDEQTVTIALKTL